MENMNWNYPTLIWFGLNRVKEIQNACNNLGIKKPLIVTDPGILKTDIISKVNQSLNIDAAIPGLVKGGFYHAGQVCVSVQRIYVHNSNIYLFL